MRHVDDDDGDDSSYARFWLLIQKSEHDGERREWGVAMLLTTYCSDERTTRLWYSRCVLQGRLKVNTITFACNILAFAIYCSSSSSSGVVGREKAHGSLYMGEERTCSLGAELTEWLCNPELLLFIIHTHTHAFSGYICSNKFVGLRFAKGP